MKTATTTTNRATTTIIFKAWDCFSSIMGLVYQRGTHGANGD
jgi:hypothetical protein